MDKTQIEKDQQDLMKKWSTLITSFKNKSNPSQQLNKQKDKMKNFHYRIIQVI